MRLKNMLDVNVIEDKNDIHVNKIYAGILDNRILSFPVFFGSWVVFGLFL